MTWTHDLALVAAALIILVGIALALPRKVRTIAQYAPARARLAPATPHDLGRAHRLAARMLQSSYRPADEEFVVESQLWPSAEALPYVARTWDLTLPLLGLEDLLEKLEALSARIARLGRRRGKS